MTAIKTGCANKVLLLFYSEKMPKTSVTNRNCGIVNCWVNVLSVFLTLWKGRWFNVKTEFSAGLNLLFFSFLFNLRYPVLKLIWSGLSMTTKLSGRQFKPLISDNFFLSVSDDRSHVILELFSVFAHKKSSTC